MIIIFSQSYLLKHFFYNFYSCICITMIGLFVPRGNMFSEHCQLSQATILVVTCSCDCIKATFLIFGDFHFNDFY